MKLHELSPAPGSTRKKLRKGRGMASGHGKTAGRGHKGQNSRSGGGVRPGFEGGQLPIYRKLPKRGFKNPFSKEYAIINVADLERFDAGSTVDFYVLRESGLLKKQLHGLKILGSGDLTKALTVKAAVFSESAKEKIIAAGGKAEVV